MIIHRGRNQRVSSFIKKRNSIDCENWLEKLEFDFWLQSLSKNYILSFFLFLFCCSLSLISDSQNSRSIFIFKNFKLWFFSPFIFNIGKKSLIIRRVFRFFIGNELNLFSNKLVKRIEFFNIRFEIFLESRYLEFLTTGFAIGEPILWVTFIFTLNKIFLNQIIWNKN